MKYARGWEKLHGYTPLSSLVSQITISEVDTSIRTQISEPAETNHSTSEQVSVKEGNVADESHGCSDGEMLSVWHRS